MRAKLVNEAIKHLAPKSDEELISSVKRLEKEHGVKFKNVDKFIIALRKIGIFAVLNYNEDEEFYIDCTEFNENYLSVYVEIENEEETYFILEDNGPVKASNLLLDGKNWIKALKVIKEYFGKNVNEAIKHLSGYSHEDLYKKYAKKFRLASFKKELFKYTKENLEQIDDEMIYYAKKKGHILDNQYYYRIGTEIGQFIDKFYPFNDHPDSEEWQDGLPADQNDDFHPTIVKIIQDWIAKEFPNWTEDDIAEFWEAITIHMGEWR